MEKYRLNKYNYMIHMMKRAPFFNIIDSQTTSHHIDNIMENNNYRFINYNPSYSEYNGEI